MEFPTVNGTKVFSEPPEGYVVDFDNPKQQKVLEHYAIFAVFGTLAFVALCQRYYTKIWLSKGLQVDDFFMLLGWITSILTQALLTQSITEGSFLAHSWEQPLERYEKYSLQSYIAAAVFMLCNGCTKLSLLTFYLHLSPQKWFRISVWTSIVIVSLYTIIITSLLFFHCTPPQKAFRFETEGSCMDVAILYMATAVSNVVTDLILFVLPIPMVYQLHMPVQQKIGAIVVFGIGSATIATSIVRLALLPAVLQSTDPSWDAAPANIWSFLEANLFVICGSMPTLRKFFKHVAPAIMGGSSNRSTTYANSYAMNRSGAAALSRSRKKRSQYEHFDDDNEMGIYPSTPTDGNNHGINQGDKGNGNGATVTVNADRDRDRGSASGEGDNHSEKAILQTKSFTVQYD